MRSMTTETTIAFWKNALIELANSGMTVREFCRRIGKTPHQFRYWKSRIAGATATIPKAPTDANRFMELKAVHHQNVDRRYVDVQIGPCMIRLTDDTAEDLFKRAAAMALAVQRNMEIGV